MNAQKSWLKATKIQFTQNGGNATTTGVQFTASGTSYTVSAGKEVILSAGSLHTPQLLELSGIGDEARLSALGIPVVVANSDVGENLQVWCFLLVIHYTFTDSLNRITKPYIPISYSLIPTSQPSVSNFTHIIPASLF